MGEKEIGTSAERKTRRHHHGYCDARARMNRAALAILKWPEAKIVILTSYLDNEKIYLSQMPVQRYILRTSSATEDLAVHPEGCKGEFAIETEVSQKVESRKNHAELHDDLTARERDILAHINKRI